MAGGRHWTHTVLLFCLVYYCSVGRVAGLVSRAALLKQVSKSDTLSQGKVPFKKLHYFHFQSQAVRVRLLLQCFAL